MVADYIGGDEGEEEEGRKGGAGGIVFVLIAVSGESRPGYRYRHEIDQTNAGWFGLLYVKSGGGRRRRRREQRDCFGFVMDRQTCRCRVRARYSTSQSRNSSQVNSGASAAEG